MSTAEKIRITEQNVALGLQSRANLESLAPRPAATPLNIPGSWAARQRTLAGEYGRPRRNGNTISHEVTRTAAGAGGHNPVPLNLLLKHMEAHYGECQLRHDLDCILPLCATEEDRKAVREFARAKLAGKAYQGHGVTTLGKTCESCCKPFAAKRSTARFCDAACRKRGSRRAA
jgi:hypothetical protein